MNNTDLFASLNQQQYAAVTAKPRHTLVLAGAGSGKTRVLVHRITWLVQVEKVSPFAILAVTFTNKASNEMRSRIEQLSGMSVNGMWVGTFHGLAHRLLRTHWEAAELPENFQILDSNDQLRLIRRIHRNLALDENKWPPKQSQWFINQCKEEGKRARHVELQSGYFVEVMQKVYQAYEDLCISSGLLDFGELLVRSLELFQYRDELTVHYQDRFRHILVDEFQDTNTIQYLWLKKLVGPKTCLMAVGDDDQSIYSWRGAKVENIHRFSSDYQEAETICLEQNYRSTQVILDAANAVIGHNQNRLGKKLWTEGGAGEKIVLYSAFNERDEVYYVVNQIDSLVAKGYRYCDIAVLYRSNAQSRVLEERLIETQVAYRVYGGQRFFERSEIKDALAYWRLIVNHDDDAAFERIVNTPARGIGHTTLDMLRVEARALQKSLWKTAHGLIASGRLSAKVSGALQRFVRLIESIDQAITDQSLEGQLEGLLNQSGLLAFYQKDKTEKGLSRIENLQELLDAAAQFELSAEVQGGSLRDAFLAYVVLDSGESQTQNSAEYVSLMTLHSAKGLEFPIVFIVGMEETLFPHKMSLDDPLGLEEERRLCYVGMTRAMKKLYLSCAESRRLHGYERYHRPSRFLQEIPSTCIDAIRPTAVVSKPVMFSAGRLSTRSSQKPLSKSVLSDWTAGQRVRHKKFGEGVVLLCEGEGKHVRIQVRFDSGSTKWLVASYANLETF